jgi:hypothetical protein
VVVEVDRFFHQTHAKGLGIKLKIFDGIIYRCRYVVNAFDELSGIHVVIFFGKKTIKSWWRQGQNEGMRGKNYRLGGRDESGLEIAYILSRPKITLHSEGYS